MEQSSKDIVTLSDGLVISLSRKKPEEQTEHDIAAAAAAAASSRAGPRGALVERVNNVWGSTAGAGSDFFHIYRKHRAVETERLRKMDEDYEREKEETEFQERRTALVRKDQERANKRTAKRKQMKCRQIEKKKLKKEAADRNSFKNDGTFLAQFGAVNPEFVLE